MNFYSDFNAMFNAQSGLKQDMSVFNQIRLSEDDRRPCYEIRAYLIRQGWSVARASVYVYGQDEDPKYTRSLIITDTYPHKWGLDPITEDDLRDTLRSAGCKLDVEVTSDPSGALWVLGPAPLGRDIAKRIAEILDDKFGGAYDI